MTPALAMLVGGAVTFIIAAITLGIVEYITTGSKSGRWGGKCDQNCPICADFAEIDFGHDAVQLAADQSADPQK